MKFSRVSTNRKLTWGGGYHDRIIIGNYDNFLCAVHGIYLGGESPLYA